MIKFSHERVFCTRPIDFVIEHIAESAPGYYDKKKSHEGLHARLLALTNIVGAMALLLSESQQKELVERFSNEWIVAPLDAE